MNFHKSKFSKNKSDLTASILMISPVVPCDTGMGIQKRAAAHVKALSTRGHVYLIVFKAHTGALDDLEPALKKLCTYVQIIPFTERPRKIFSSYPPFSIISEIMTPRSERMVPREDLLGQAIEAITHITFDDVFCFRIRSGLILERLLNVTSLKVKRKIVDYDDIESAVQIRSDSFSLENKGIEQKFVEKIMLHRLKAIENKFLHSFQDVLVCSDLDKKTLEAKNPTAQIHVIPNSVPLEKMTEHHRNKDVCNILFVGTMSYGPNEDGIIWFCHEILPIIRKNTDKDLELFAVGFNPPESVRALGRLAGVTVTGGVDSVTPYYQNSDIVIAPIRYGGGTRIKILEAMSFQKAVISTTIGAEGIDIEDGISIRLADKPEDFAKACITLIENETRCADIGLAARECIEQNYSDKEVARKLCQIF